MTTPSTEGLKPCPLCNSEIAPTADKAALSGRWRIICDSEQEGCGLIIVRSTREEAIESWNRRPAQASEVVIHNKAIRESVGAISHIDDGESPAYPACQEAIRKLLLQSITSAEPVISVKVARKRMRQEIKSTFMVDGRTISRLVDAASPTQSMKDE